MRATHPLPLVFAVAALLSAVLTIAFFFGGAAVCRFSLKSAVARLPDGNTLPISRRVNRHRLALRHRPGREGKEGRSGRTPANVLGMEC